MVLRLTPDVLIVGSGPIGATFAAEIRKHKAQADICMIDVGALESASPGSHKRNAFDYQKNIDRFGSVIQGALSPCSVPVSHVPATTLDPNAFAPWREDTVNEWFLPQNQNPDQQPEVNLAAESITRVVGGMATHWTCVCPELEDKLGRPRLEIDDTRNNVAWRALYEQAKALLQVANAAEFNEDSLRHTVIVETLKHAHRTRIIGALPLACHRIANKKFFNWHSANTILTGIDIDNPHPFKLTVSSEYADVTAEKFVLKPNVCCTALQLSHDNKSIESAKCHNLYDDTYFEIKAKIYIIAAGAVSTPQLLVKSGIDKITPALGKYITDHTMAFCQIVLNRDIVNNIRNLKDIAPRFLPLIEKHIKDHPNDPVAIPYDDPEPQIRVSPTEGTPWQGQIQRDAFYGVVPDNIDPRIVVDFRFYGQIEPEATNTLTFSEKSLDTWGMPQPTFNFRLGNASKLEAHRMMADMVELATSIGGFLPGAEPRFMERGSVPHLAGTTRAIQPGVSGHDTKATCVVDTNSKVLDVTNLFLGGNGVIPTKYAANPTLTSVAYAVRSAQHICDDPNLWNVISTRGTLSGRSGRSRINRETFDKHMRASRL